MTLAWCGTRVQRADRSLALRRTLSTPPRRRIHRRTDLQCDRTPLLRRCYRRVITVRLRIAGALTFCVFTWRKAVLSGGGEGQNNIISIAVFLCTTPSVTHSGQHPSYSRLPVRCGPVLSSSRWPTSFQMGCGRKYAPHPPSDRRSTPRSARRLLTLSAHCGNPFRSASC